MTHYDVTYSCGHEGRITAIGSKRSREWAVESAEKGLCPECYQAKIAADREAAQAAARAEAEEQELPALEGSEKQVAWALTIRSKWLAAFERYLEGNPLSEKANPLHRARFLQAVEMLQREQSAKWWIENGREPDGMTMQRLLKEKFVMLSKIAECGAGKVEAKLAQSLRPEVAITAALSEEFGADQVTQFTGETKQRDRPQQVKRFKGSARFFVSTQGCGGHGLTLNEAHNTIFFSNGFKYDDRRQAEDRCHRYGQTKDVNYIDIHADGTIDDRISAALSKKQNVAAAFRHEVDKIKDDKAKLRDLVKLL